MIENNKLLFSKVTLVTNIDYNQTFTFLSNILKK